MRNFYHLLGCDLDKDTFKKLETFYLSYLYKETNCVYNLLVQYMESMGELFHLADTSPQETLESKLDQISYDQLNLYLLKINLLALVTVALRYNYYQEDSDVTLDFWLAQNRTLPPQSRTEVWSQYDDLIEQIKLPEELKSYNCFTTPSNKILISTDYLCKRSRDLWNTSRD